LSAEITRILPLLEAGKDLRSEILFDTKFGGLHPTIESTWPRLLEELIHVFRDQSIFKGKDHVPVVLLVLKVIAKNAPIEKRWTEVREIILDRIPQLSGWETSWKRQASRSRSVVRRGGRYFMEHEGEEVELVGGSTELEDAWSTYHWAISSGPVRSLLKLVALEFICYEMLRGRIRPPKGMVLVLTDASQGQTYFLNWHWYAKFPYELRPFQWRPTQAHCSPEWLAADLIGSLYERDKIPQAELVQYDYDQLGIPVEWLGKLKGYKATLLIHLETSLRFSTESGKATPGTLFVHEELPILWVNSTYTTATQLIVPLKNMNRSDEEYGVALRLISQLAFEYDHPITDHFAYSSGGIPKTFSSTAQRGAGTVYPLPREQGQLARSETFAHALALYREGLNSNSPFLSFLRFYECIELGFKAKTETKVKNWIRENLGQIRGRGVSDRLTELSSERVGDIADYLATESRNAVAHVYLSNKDSKRFEITESPDDTKNRMRFVKDNDLMKALARKMITSGLIK
jgi:hypothetical protein